MSPQKKVDEQYLRLSMEHTLILDAIQGFEEILSKPGAPQSFPTLKEKMKTFETDCRDHFDLEERVLFPAALACLSSLEIVDTVLLMQKEHGYLERDLDGLLTLIQKQPKKVKTAPAATSKFNAAQAAKTGQSQARLSQERSLETHIDIGGMAPSDLQVAAYIEHLSNSHLFNNVALVESKEYTVDETTFRQFKLSAILGKEVHLTADDVELIRGGAEESVYRF